MKELYSPFVRCWLALLGQTPIKAANRALEAKARAVGFRVYSLLISAFSALDTLGVLVGEGLRPSPALSQRWQRATGLVS